MTRAGLLLLGCAMLAGCGAGGKADGPGSARYALVPAAGGLDVAGSGGREIGFGRDQEGVLQSIEKVEGRRPRAVACSGGLSGFAARDGLRLAFEQGTFVGWDGPAGRAGRSCA